MSFCFTDRAIISARYVRETSARSRSAGRSPILILVILPRPRSSTRSLAEKRGTDETGRVFTCVRDISACVRDEEGRAAFGRKLYPTDVHQIRGTRVRRR